MDEIQKQMEYSNQIKKENQGKNLKYHILTMGCQLNENDSEKISGMLEEMGYSLTQELKEEKLEKSKRIKKRKMSY